MGSPSLAAVRRRSPRTTSAAPSRSATRGCSFPVGFYLVALIFIVFDALAVFLFPWALTLRALGAGGPGGDAGRSSAILALGWVYAYREGILEWK